jgi:exonuclease SbcC
MRIQLKKLIITNFKGIHKFECVLNHITNVFGDNATGKTTIFDAFLWLFFGKNSEDAAKFEIKPLDKSNRFIKDIEAEVSAVIQADDVEIIAKKVLRQKWVKKRGEPIPVYQGDENIYYWNDVPLKESEFKVKIAQIVDENIFKLITNPFYFNSLNWEKRRNILIEIAGEINNNDVFDAIITPASKLQFDELRKALAAAKSIDEFKRELAAKKKKVKDEAESIPSRIDEVRRGMPEPLDFKAIREQIAASKQEQQELVDIVNNEVKRRELENKKGSDLLLEYNRQVNERQQKVFSIKTRMQNIEFELKQQARDAGGKIEAEIKSLAGSIADKQLDADRYIRSVQQFNADVDEKENQLQALRNKYADEDALQLDFNDNEFNCPACKQQLPLTDIDAKKEELTANFNRNKKLNLDRIINQANDIKKELEILKTRIANGNASIQALNEEVKILQTKLQETQQKALAPKKDIVAIVADLIYNHAEYKQLVDELSATEAIVLTKPEFAPLPVNDELKEKASIISNAIAELQKELNKEDQINKANERIKELELQETTLAQQLSELEGTEFAIMQFTKAKVDAIEKRINGKFKVVKFKMFTTQVNGGEAECCETLVPGVSGLVPFSDANNAARINAGIDIINTLCERYKVHAPIFLDNRESVTKIIETDSQVVNLIVSEADKKLRVA